MSTTTQYVMSKAIHFTTKKHYGRVGDVMMYQPPKVTIYRGGKLMTSFDLSRAAVEALIKNGVMRSVEHAEAEPQAPSPEFTEKLSAALAGIETRIFGGEDVSEELVATLREWIVTHIGIEDVEYADFFGTQASA